jgi:hypothetical protein
MKEKTIEQLKKDIIGSIQGLAVFIIIALVFFRHFIWIYIPIIAIAYSAIETTIILNLRQRGSPYKEVKLAKVVAGSWFAVFFVGFILYIIFKFSWIFWIPVCFILLGAITTTSEYPGKLRKLRTETASNENTNAPIGAPPPIYQENGQVTTNNNKSEPKFCPHCGTSINPGVKFCSLCGHQL